MSRVEWSSGKDSDSPTRLPPPYFFLLRRALHCLHALCKTITACASQGKVGESSYWAELLGPFYWAELLYQCKLGKKDFQEHSKNGEDGETSVYMR
jgi:hypothetical protein